MNSTFLYFISYIGLMFQNLEKANFFIFIEKLMEYSPLKMTIFTI